MFEGLLGNAGLPEGFIGLGLFAVLPTVLPVVVPGDVPVELPTDGAVVVPGEDVPIEDVPPVLPVPLVPPAPLACARAIVLESASAPANAKVAIFMFVFPWLRQNQWEAAIFVPDARAMVLCMDCHQADVRLPSIANLHCPASAAYPHRSSRARRCVPRWARPRLGLEHLGSN